MLRLPAAVVLAIVSAGANAQLLQLDNVTPPIPLISSSTVSAVQIDPANGNVTVRSSTQNLTQCSGQVQNPAEITSFTLNPSSVLTNGTFTVSWSAINTNAGSPCTPSGGAGTTWASQGQQPAIGQLNLSAPATAQTINFTLTCAGPGGSDQETRTLTVTTNGGGGNCTAPFPVNPVNWSQWWTTAFPSHPGGRRQWIATQGNIDSISFVASSATNQFGSIAASGFPGDGEGAMQMSISSVAGCYTPANLGPNCLSPVSSGASVGWAIGSSQFSCALTPGATYFLNLTFGSASGPGSGPFCVTGACGRDISSLNQRSPD